jgi:preprotein translocase subunit SecE
MARQTRSQRRARRQAQAESGGVVQRARTRQQQVRPSAQAPKSQGGQRRVSEGGFLRFAKESWGELNKVEWPNRSQVIQGTVVVLIACAIVGLYLYLNDQVWKRVVEAILGQ